MTSGAAEEVCVAVVYLAPDQSLPRILILAAATLRAHVLLVEVAGFAGRNAGLESDFGIEEGLFEIQRLEDLAVGQILEMVTSHAFEQDAERDETEIAVDHA